MRSVQGKKEEMKTEFEGDGGERRWQLKAPNGGVISHTSSLLWQVHFSILRVISLLSPPAVTLVSSVAGEGGEKKALKGKESA